MKLIFQALLLGIINLWLSKNTSYYDIILLHKILCGVSFTIAGVLIMFEINDYIILCISYYKERKEK